MTAPQPASAPSPRPKVFVIGFHKTGCSSLGVALGRLGYAVTGPNNIRDPDVARNAWHVCQALIPRFDAFKDNPWPLFYRELYGLRPDAKFILTIRDSGAWIASALRYFGSAATPMRQWIYGAGSPIDNEEVYVARYEQHNRDAMAFFAGKPSSMLVMDLADGDGWDKLCAFLGAERPEGAFPHVNVAADAHAAKLRLREHSNVRVLP